MFIQKETDLTLFYISDAHKFQFTVLLGIEANQMIFYLVNNNNLSF